LDNKTIKITPYLVIGIGIMAVSSASILIRFAQGSVSSIVIAAYRLSIAALILLPFVWIHYRQALKALTVSQIIYTFVSGLFLAIHFATWISSLEYTSITSSVVLVTTTPIWVAIFSPIFLKEKNSLAIWVGILITILGSIFITLAQVCTLHDSHFVCVMEDGYRGTTTMLGNFLAVCGAWAAAGYLMVGRKVRKDIPITAYIFCVYSTAAILLIITSVFLGHKLFGFQPQSYLWLILLGLIPQLIGHSSFNYALGYLPAAFVSVTLVGEPLGTIVLAFFLLQEQPGVGELVGGFFILAGIIIISLVNRRH
jgi:drug/metabolite transporter (DMT)-like permease